MPAVKSKTFRIPLSREPKKNDVILLFATVGGEVSSYCKSSVYDGSSWPTFSSDTAYQSEPSYSNGFISFSVYYLTEIPFKATYVTGWEDS